MALATGDPASQTHETIGQRQEAKYCWQASSLTNFA